MASRAAKSIAEHGRAPQLSCLGTRIETQRVACSRRPCGRVACWFNVVAHILASVSRPTYVFSPRVGLRVNTPSVACCVSGQLGSTGTGPGQGNRGQALGAR
eukprot:1491698-Pyramimonas_sp.AAC.1